MNPSSEKLPFTCPVCGRKKDYSTSDLFEGAVLTCPHCKLVLTLHGHMWQEVQKELGKRSQSKDRKTEKKSLP